MTNYTIFHNVHPDRYWDGYIPGAPMWADPNVYAIDNPDPLEAIFMRHNMDSRPDGHLAPSLSVGDVIALYPDTGDSITFHAVADLGFVTVDSPANIIDETSWSAARASAERDAA